MAWRALGAVLDRLRSLPDGPSQIDWRSRGGQGEVKGASLAGHGPWEALLSKIID